MLRGVDLVRKLLQSSLITSTRRIVHTAFDKHLFFTNVTLSFSLSGIGDILQQHHNIIYKQQTTWDIARTRHMTCTGITVGALCHHWYILLDRKLPGRTLKAVMKKLLVDQLLFSPICLTVFFISLGFFRGGDWDEFFTDIRHKGWRLYAAE
ncbi:mpv17-like protein 2 isoform X2 [Cherax quadricarinatus]